VLHEIRLALIVKDRAVKNIPFNSKPGQFQHLQFSENIPLLALKFAHPKNSNL